MADRVDRTQEGKQGRAHGSAQEIAEGVTGRGGRGASAIWEIQDTRQAGIHLGSHSATLGTNAGCCRKNFGCAIDALEEKHVAGHTGSQPGAHEETGP